MDRQHPLLIPPPPFSRFLARGTFEEYQELLILWGYVVIWSPAAPITVAVIWLSHVIELRGDAWSLLTLQRRAVAEPVRGRVCGCVLKGGGGAIVAVLVCIKCGTRVRFHAVVNYRRHHSTPLLSSLSTTSCPPLPSSGLSGQTRGIGAFLSLFQAMAWVAIPVNLGLVFFTAKTFAGVFPSDLVKFGVVVCIEHAIILLKVSSCGVWACVALSEGVCAFECAGVGCRE